MKATNTVPEGLQILLLMAGPDDAFREAGYHYPKNLVEIDGLPLVQVVLEKLGRLRQEAARIICVLKKEEDRKDHTGAVVCLVEPRATIVTVNKTAGAACTALLAIEQLDAARPLVIVNGDQFIKSDLAAVIGDFQARGLDGGIVVFEAVHPRWSYVRCDAQGRVLETAEKRPISNLATAGVYYFARAGDYALAAMEMIKKDAHVGGGFYVCPAYNEMILRHANIGIAKISRSEYHSFANPAGVHAYERQLDPAKN
jgi:dTDP-glucose pyrophosphorylase